MKPILSYIILLSLFLIFSCESPEGPDTTPPTITITLLTEGSVSEVISISCISTDNKGIKKVELWVNDVSTGIIDETEPYSLDWNTTIYDDGSYVITVRSYDTSDNTTDSDPITLTVDNSVSYPQSVSINSIVFEDGSFTITWNQSTDGDFGSYNLEKSVESTMDDYGVVYITENVTDTTYVDTDVDPLSYLYYRVSVIDTFSYETKGPILSSSLDQFPTPVNVTSVNYTLTDMTVEWTESQDGDFRDYKLFYSESYSGEKDTLVTYTDKSTTSHTLSDFDPSHQNWFWILVSDTLGQSSLSNGKSNSIDYPTQINITSVEYDLENMTVIWDKSSVWDFESYILYFSESEYGNKTVVSTINDINTNSYSTSDFSPLQENWYWIEVVDVWGLKTMGDGYTNSLDTNPNTVDVTSVSYDLENMTIIWNEYSPDLNRIQMMNNESEQTTSTSDNDFVSYELLQSSLEDGNYETVVVIDDISTTSYSITDYDPTIENWFKIRVTDFWGLTSIGNGMTNEIDNPPTLINITSVDYDLENMTIIWEESSDNDFVSYELLQSSSEDGNYETVIVIDDISTTSYSISVFNPSIENWFKIKVTDIWGLTSIGEGMTNDIDSSPTQVQLDVIIYENNSFIISWSENNDNDFISYKLYESYSEDFNDPTEVFSTTNYTEINTIITDVNISGYIYYQIVVSDIWGLQTGSNIQVGDSFIRFVSSWGEWSQDYGYSVKQTSDSGYIITGSQYSGGRKIILVKTDVNGNEEWNQTYNCGSGYGYSVEQTDDGYIIVGTCIIKTNSQGNEEWNNESIGFSVQQTNDGGYVITGSTDGKILLIKIDYNGIEVWSRTYFNETNYGGGNGRSVQQTNDGGYIITGYIYDDGIGRVFLIKTDSNGIEEWIQTESGGGYSVEQTDDGGYIVVGKMGNQYPDVLIFKTDSNGIEEWKQIFGGGGWYENIGYSVEQTDDGGYIITGSTETYGTGDMSNPDIWLIKTDSNGNEEWSQTFGSQFGEYGYSVEQTDDGGYIIVGYGSCSSGGSDIILIKTDSEGNTSTDIPCSGWE